VHRKPPSPNRPAWHRRLRWRRVLLGLALLGVAGLIGAGAAATYRPQWYTPPTVNYAQVRHDKAALLTLQDRISAALNAGHELAFELNEAQLNRWLAARGEMWPELEELPPGITLPYVRLLDGAARCGVTVSGRAGQAVLSATVGVRVTEDEIVLEGRELAVGALPAPVSWLLKRWRMDGQDPLAMQNDASTGELRLRNRWVWPNGKRPCRLRELRIHDGGAEVVIAPR